MRTLTEAPSIEVLVANYRHSAAKIREGADADGLPSRDRHSTWNSTVATHTERIEAIDNYMRNHDEARFHHVLTHLRDERHHLDEGAVIAAQIEGMLR